MMGPSKEQDAARRRELGEFLRARREILQPEDLGLPRRGRRRVKGLRRHEVADLAVVSVTWYTWLEQGRQLRTSPTVLHAVARALRLDPQSQRHLFRLAGEPTDVRQPPTGPIDEGLLALLRTVLPSPAYLVTPAADIVAWNEAYSRLFEDPGKLPNAHRNALWMTLLSPSIRDYLEDWEIEASDAIARFRSEFAKFPGDNRFEQLIAELTETSELFRSKWGEQKVASFVAHEQVVNHPIAGEIRTQLLQLRPLHEAALTVFVHLPVEKASRERLQKLIGVLRPESASSAVS
jgi:transcriptional regulator with XRE-family HTH domain